MELLLRIAGSLASKAAKKRLFRSSYLPFLRYLGCYQQAFELGAVFGYMYRQNPLVLGKLLAQPGREAEFLAFLREQGRNRFAQLGAEPNDFFDIAMAPEQGSYRKNWQQQGIPPSRIQIAERRCKVPIKSAFDGLVVAVSTGIGFGLDSPHLIEKLWRNQYESPVSQEQWRTAKDAGLVLSDADEQVSRTSLAQRQTDVLAGLEILVAEVWPDQVGLLGLAQTTTTVTKTDSQK